MKITVDHERCEGHGMCAISAPDLFTLDDDGILRYAHEGRDVPADAETAAHVAVATCPVAALHQTA
jgi:ferredoxin